MCKSLAFVFPDELAQYPCLHRGKVRQLYALDAEKMLMVASDRLSAFDVILATPIPNKGVILTQVSHFWWTFFHEVPNHALSLPLSDYLPPHLVEALDKRSVIVRRLTPLPVEMVVRGYLAGSAWKDYQAHHAVQGIPLPKGLTLAALLPQVLVTPTTKAPVGQKDLPLTPESFVEYLCAALANPPWEYEKNRVLTIADALVQTTRALYQRAHDFLWERGLILADAKLEWALDNGELILIDELFTPDSARYWERATWVPGENPPSFDKQGVRDYLAQHPEAIHQPLPEWLVTDTIERYQTLAQRLGIVC